MRRAMRVTFLDSVQAHQTERVRAMAARLRRWRSDITVEFLVGDAAKAALQQHKLTFGPAILVDGRLEYVGIPRWRFLQERLAQVDQGLPNPRTSAPPEPAKPVVPAKPATPPPAAPPPTAAPRQAPKPAAKTGDPAPRA